MGQYMLIFYYLLFFLSIPLHTTPNPITEPEYWINYEKEIKLLPTNPVHKASFEVMGLSYGFKLAKNHFAQNCLCRTAKAVN